jgi:hypothetical protein
MPKINYKCKIFVLPIIEEEDACETVARLYDCAKDTNQALLTDIINIITTEV